MFVIHVSSYMRWLHLISHVNKWKPPLAIDLKWLKHSLYYCDKHEIFICNKESSLNHLTCVYAFTYHCVCNVQNYITAFTIFVVNIGIYMVLTQCTIHTPSQTSFFNVYIIYKCYWWKTEIIWNGVCVFYHRRT